MDIKRLRIYSENMVLVGHNTGGSMISSCGSNVLSNWYFDSVLGNDTARHGEADHSV